LLTGRIGQSIGLHRELLGKSVDWMSQNADIRANRLGNRRPLRKRGVLR
jgi:hypothetical protein